MIVSLLAFLNVYVAEKLKKNVKWRREGIDHHENTC
jgi:hypothetical protein